MDRISKAGRSKIMSRIRSKDSLPEVMLRSSLWNLGARYRKYYGPEKIDIAFPGKKLAVFVDGCFWHSCPEHRHIPKSNESYWKPKLAKNIERASKKNVRLKKEGWCVIHIWEHEVNADAESCAKRIALLLSFNGKERRT
jgi:DNA mismatch endonuclease (patch repair protein)